MGHELHTVANTQHGDAHREQRGIDHGSALVEYRGGTAGKNQRIRRKGADFLRRDAERLNFAVNTAFTNAAGNQQIILTAKIQNQNAFHSAILPKYDFAAVHRINDRQRVHVVAFPAQGIASVLEAFFHGDTNAH